MRRVILIIVAVLLVSVATWYFRRGSDRALGLGRGATADASARGSAEDSRSTGVPPSTMARANSGGPAQHGSPSSSGAAWSREDFPLAADLNAPSSTIARDVDLVRQILEGWRTNFPHEGNPVGENSEITAALLGDNRLGLALVPKGHPAVNERGELCDRWGTPFRFHALSGTRMEIRSAGPDRKFGTSDDTVWSPE